MSSSSSRDPKGFLTSRIAKADGDILKAKWVKMEDYYGKRLWHQLSLALLDYVTSKDFSGGAELYKEFIADFESKLNPLSLVDICLPIWGEMTSGGDKEGTLEFIGKIGEKVKNHSEAFCLTRVVTGNLYLEHFKSLQETKKIIEEVDDLLSSIKGVGKVHSRFYFLSSDYYKQRGDHEKYYRASLHYLGCTDLGDLEAENKRFLAFHLGLAAILGNGIYNFGELLAHPVLASLKGTNDEWLINFLYAFNSGDVAKYEALKPKWSAQPDLAANETVMFEKLCLLTLMEMAFRRVGSADRVLTFAQIAETTGLPINQVELLVMKALAQGLVKGHIDQVDATVNLTWVQPRVLDMDQVKTIADKIKLWNTSINSLENILENNASEILTI